MRIIPISSAVMTVLLLLLPTFTLSAAFVVVQQPHPPHNAAFSRFARKSVTPILQPIFHHEQHSKKLTAAARTTLLLSAATTASSSSTLTPLLHAALKKPSKTLAVCLEYYPDGDLSSVDLQTLSMQLRKLKAASIATSNLQAVQEFATEQASAAGNFPGPCPVIYNGDKVNKAVEAGASAVVMNVQELEAAAELLPANTETIWRVKSTKDVQDVLDAGRGGGAFMINGEQDNIKDMIDAIPKNAVIIGSVDAMQDDNAEIETSKKLQKLGCTSIYIKKAAVGDSEDLDYAAYCIDSLTKKKSTQFNMTGLTGSVNGHFGGVASSGTVTWSRQNTM